MLQAAEKGVPFMPLRGIIGSDILTHRPDWWVIDNPFTSGADPIVLLPALSPDIAAFHAVMADRDGNVYVGRRHELATMAHPARRSERRSRGAIPSRRPSSVRNSCAAGTHNR
jgi:glutaconate CoA-transferase subunit A